jgi:hypothetical protein
MTEAPLPYVPHEYRIAAVDGVSYRITDLEYVLGVVSPPEG